MWHGKIHEYILPTFGIVPDREIRITYTIGEAHKRDPRRNFRILEAALQEEPDNRRYQYTAGREYYGNALYPQAIYWLERYFRNTGVGGWIAEKADARFTLGMAYLKAGEPDMAREEMLKAVALNADFIEALIMLATLSADSVSREQWTLLAAHAQNRNLNFTYKGASCLKV
jgi:tetratricopeptide (TPR) repeat protein